MKTISKLFLLVSFFYFLNTNAQAPDKMSYQAVIRNASNTLVANANVGMKISILQGSATGTSVFSQTQTATTNANGLVSISFGAGGFATGDFASINWENGPYFIKTETDPTGGSNYTITSTTQLLSVPYALYAKTAGSSASTNAWGLSGNAGTTTANFIGTTDDKDLQLKVNNQKAGVIETNDNTSNNLKNANTGLGYQTLNSNITGSGNTSVGYQTLYSNIDGNSNTGIGHMALHSNTVGWDNTAVGNGALYANTTGIENTANGYGALSSNTTGNKNSASGNSALYNNTTGDKNVANGYQSLYSNTTGTANIASGSKVLYHNTTGVGNAAYGEEANSTNTTGGDNIGVGFHSLGGIDANGNRIFGNETGNQNVAIGAFAGDNIGSNTNGSLFLGTNAKATSNNTNLTNATAIGKNATVNQDNSIILGAINGINGATADTKVGIGTNTPLASLDVNGQILTRNRVVLGQTAPTGDPSSTPVWAMDNSNNNFRIFKQPNISSSESTYLSIAPNGDTTLNGYTKLGGSDAPAIKMKYITGTTAATEGGEVIIYPNIPILSEIISLSVLVQSDWGWITSYPYIGGEYWVRIVGNGIYIKNANQNSNAILSKPIRISIIYY